MFCVGVLRARCTVGVSRRFRAKRNDGSAFVAPRDNRSERGQTLPRASSSKVSAESLQEPRRRLPRCSARRNRSMPSPRRRRARAPPSPRPRNRPPRTCKPWPPQPRNFRPRGRRSPVRSPRSASIAQGAVAQANRTNAMVEGLVESTQKIGEVMGLIQNIAAQTNLGLERDHRSRAGRRGRQGLCRSGARSEGALDPDRQGDRGDFRPDPGHPRRHRGDGRGHSRDRHHHQPDR